MTAIPKTMRAIAIVRDGAEGRMEIAHIEVPKPGPGQVLIRMAAAGVNHADLLQVAGRYPPPPGAPDTPGMEVSGTIIATGDGVDASMGAEVCALIPGGGYAEYAVASVLCVLPIPDRVSLIDAGGLPETYFTVWTNVIGSGRLKPGETFLVHGGSSGIGTTAIQLMHARGHKVFTTAGNEEKCAACRALGAARAINYRAEDFVAAIAKETDGRGVDVILDMVGGDYVGRNLQSLARHGRLVNIAYMKGAKTEVDLRPMQERHLTMTATGLRGRSDAEKGAIRDALLAEVWPLFGERRLRPVIDRSFPLAEAEAAHAAMRESGHIGKILLVP